MSSIHMSRPARLRMTATADCTLSAAPIIPGRRRRPATSAPGVGSDSTVRLTRFSGLSDVDLLITDCGLSPDNAAVMERGGMEVVRA